jgi:hypothetical protein
MPGNKVTVDDPRVLTALKAKKTLNLQWNAGARTCTIKVKFAADSAPTALPPAAAAADEITECAKAAETYNTKIPDPTHALVVFCGNGTALQSSSRPRDVVVVGDPIYVGVFTNTNQTNINIEWPNCGPRDATPKRFGTTNFNSLPALTGAAVNKMTPESPSVHRQCYNTSPQIKVTSTSSDPTNLPRLDRTETIQQYELYNYSFQLGAVFTKDVNHDFAVAADGAGTSRIRDQGPVGNGPKYFAALTVYGLPWQICDAIGRCKDRGPYLGRDLVNDKGFFDRISGVLGVGLDHPQDEFVAGIGFELMPGINAIGVYRKAKINVLDGVAVGDPFTGTADDLPKQEKWEDGFEVGIAIDLIYVADWFGRK